MFWTAISKGWKVLQILSHAMVVCSTNGETMIVLGLWHAEPDLSEGKTFFNLLCTDESGELGKGFLENHDINDVMRTQLDLEWDAITRQIRFKGTIMEFCERSSKGFDGLKYDGPGHFGLFLESVAKYLDH